MGNTGVSQHPLDVCLPQSDKVSDDHSQSTDDPEKREYDLRVKGQFPKWIQQPYKDGEPNSFWPHRKEGGDRCGRTLIDVRSPHMERHYGNLKTETDYDQAQSCIGHETQARFCLKMSDDRSNAGGIGDSIEECQSIHEKSRSETPQQKIFESRFR